MAELFLFFQQIFNNFSGDDQSGNRRHKGIGCRNIPPDSTFSCCSGRTDAVRTTGNFSIFNRLDRLFFRIDDF